jgi:hypothetical protein
VLSLANRRLSSNWRKQEISPTMTRQQYCWRECDLSPDRALKIVFAVNWWDNGETPLPRRELVFGWRTGDTWAESPDKRINVPVVYLDDGQILLSRSLYAEAKQEVYCSGS